MRFPGFRENEPERERFPKLQRLLEGKTNLATFADVTLTAGAATTTLTDPKLTVLSVVELMATTANAAAAKAGIYFTGRTNGSVVINHANNAETDRTFAYAIHM